MIAAATGRMPGTINTIQIGDVWFPEKAGGLSRYYYELLGRFSRAAVACRGLVAGSHVADEQSGGAVRAFASPEDSMSARLIAGRRAVRSLLRQGEVDLIACHFAVYGFAALGALGGSPLVVHFHGPWAAEARAEGAGGLACWSKARIEQSVYGRADRLIVLSEAFSRVLKDDYHINPDRIRVVPGGVDTRRFGIAESRAESRARLGWPADRPIVLCVRRLMRRMGLENLVAAARLVRRRVPDVLFLIAGRGPLAGTLEEQIAESDLKDHVRLLGFMPDADLPVAYRAADLTVVPSSLLEGFGLTAVESLAAGTPVMVTCVGGLPEVVRSLSEKLLIPDSEPAAMADALSDGLLSLAGLPGDRQCRAYAERFDWDVVVRKLRAVYEEVLA
jgi:glycosyltransferase involved in cell wall biosynthesis